MRLPMSIAPEATRKPPTPMTTRNARFRVSDAIGTTGAEAFATSSPATQARRAPPSTDSVSRSVAPEARMVRTAEMERSTSAVSAPTASCCRRLASRMRRDSPPTTTIANSTISTVRPSSTGSSSAMPIIAPTKVKTPPTASTSPWVSTA